VLYEQNFTGKQVRESHPRIILLVPSLSSQLPEEDSPSLSISRPWQLSWASATTFLNKIDGGVSLILVHVEKLPEAPSDLGRH